ncbi:hypothetical protein PS6_004450 [Mucor atramentarius]
MEVSLPTTASKQKKRTTQQLVNTASTYGIATTTASSLKFYQLSFLNTVCCTIGYYFLLNHN